MTLIQFDPDWQAPAPLGEVSPSNWADKGIPVVIAEDDPVSRKLVSTIIEHAGYQTIVTCNGDEAMEALRAQTGPCVAVIDWMMPRMDGVEVCRRIHESGRSVYFIMLTARSAKEGAVQSIDLGADDYLVKPFNREELLARIRAGVRQLKVQLALEVRVHDLESAIIASKALKFQMPL